MDLETVSAEEFGRGLKGLGVNLLSPDVNALAKFLQSVFGVNVHRLNEDFAIMEHGGTLFQLHSDGTFGAHPLLGIVPETPPRGGGTQFYLFEIDPDQAEKTARDLGYMVLETSANKPHGLRECTILSPEGYASSPAIARGE